MIKYFPKYSDTDLPDNMGRWARIVVYKNIRIAWINRLEVKNNIVFSVTCYFPTMENDMANEYKTFFNLDEAKDFVKERWEWFLNTIS